MVRASAFHLEGRRFDSTKGYTPDRDMCASLLVSIFRTSIYMTSHFTVYTLNVLVILPYELSQTRCNHYRLVWGKVLDFETLNNKLSQKSLQAEPGLRAYIYSINVPIFTTILLEWISSLHTQNSNSIHLLILVILRS